MNYRSLADLDACVTKNLWKIPADVDLIVGIPRSGLLLANIIALHLNLPLTDLNGLIEGRLLSAGARLPGHSGSMATDCRRLAVVDDSVSSGREMRKARSLLEAAGLSHKAVYVTAYALAENVAEVDVFFEICPQPRAFAWNLMHHPFILDRACVDIDGVLCAEPAAGDDDDGERYRDFLESARPLLRPTCEVGALVTCRLEKYRPETEAWLKRHGIRYRELVMWDLPNRQARLNLGTHAEFKGAAYGARPWACVFVESSSHQAQRIANTARKPVICVETQSVYRPGAAELAVGAARNISVWAPKALRYVASAVHTLLTRLNRP